MVRFIIIHINKQQNMSKKFTFQYGQIYYRFLSVFYFVKYQIYIPIWLDLLCILGILFLLMLLHLHSNMVRFIMKQSELHVRQNSRFTFQYGQIYYYSLSLLTHILEIYLHSNMVRFIISCYGVNSMYCLQFTFQYGQIYYRFLSVFYFVKYQIYIPIWLDLLFLP